MQPVTHVGVLFNNSGTLPAGPGWGSRGDRTLEMESSAAIDQNELGAFVRRRPQRHWCAVKEFAGTAGEAEQEIDVTSCTGDFTKLARAAHELKGAAQAWGQLSLVPGPRRWSRQANPALAARPLGRWPGGHRSRRCRQSAFFISAQRHSGQPSERRSLPDSATRSVYRCIGAHAPCMQLRYGGAMASQNPACLRRRRNRCPRCPLTRVGSGVNMADAGETTNRLFIENRRMGRNLAAQRALTWSSPMRYAAQGSGCNSIDWSGVSLFPCLAARRCGRSLPARCGKLKTIGGEPPKRFTVYVLDNQDECHAGVA